ncbi:MAG: UDP-N-acetylmuramoyl-L-alanyl-D-glutamate--2,6-diaminopimelate ligase, partial [bacterium]
LRDIPCSVRGDDRARVRGVAYHSARVEPGFLFVAVAGSRVSGAAFVAEAVRRGAVAVALADSADDIGGVADMAAVVRVRDPREFLALVANRFYGDPSRGLALVGITGTNGKTTTSYLFRAVCRFRGVEPGFIGTIEHWDGRESVPAGQTTPESLDFARMLARMVELGVSPCVAEISSHGLSLGRVRGLAFRVGVFTNLTRDHLDFHRTEEAYRAAKMRLFTGLGPESHAVVNLDDPTGRGIPALTRARVLGYGTGAGRPACAGRAGRPRPDIAGRVLSAAADGLEVELVFRGRAYQARLKLAGRHNLMNLLAALGAGVALGWEPAEVLAGAASLAGVPGRLERVENDRGFGVFVDYAHTPDALARVLAAVREFSSGRVIVVFGCGGDRDREKRPLMGEAAARGADLAVVTSDNPRSEEPGAIIREVLAGMAGAEPVVLPDREEAIARALGAARPGDCVVIAGKGHEDYQLVGNVRRGFDDRQVARRLLAGAPESTAS